MMVYNNAESEKSKIISDNKGKAAIYMWVHISGKIYIGSTVDLSLRLSKYYTFSWLNQTDNYISRALLHHTHSAFSLSILEYIDIKGLSKKEARELVLGREQYYIDLIFLNDFNTYYILKEAGSSLGYIHSAETKAAISEALKGGNNAMFGKFGENHPMFGKTHSAETLK
jgi:group I intron endonuclease